MIASLLRDLLSRLRRPQRSRVICVSDDGVTLLKDGQSQGQFAWDQVIQILTFKRDLITFDDIRLAFRVPDGWVEFSEEDEGWADLRAAVAVHYPEVPTDWLSAVMFPPFETCERVLYDRDRSPDARRPIR